MSLNPGGAGNYSWNYSNPNREGYSTQLVGTVIAIQEVQKRGYTMNGQPGQPEFWPDGNPKMNIRLALVTEMGEIKTFTFQPAGKEARAGRKRSVHMDLFALTGNTDMRNLVGKTIAITTQEGRYGQGNPRPWDVQLVDAGPFQLQGPMPAEFKVEKVLANDAASGGQVTPPKPRPYTDPNIPPMAAFVGAVEQYQQQNPYIRMGYQQQPMQQPQYQQPAYNVPQQRPMYQQPAQQPVYQQPQPQYQQPAMQTQLEQQAMDPNIMAAMASQAFGGPVTVDVIPAQPTNPVGAGEVYDEDMPF